MRKTGITSELLMMYESAGLDAETTYTKSKMLLKSYRRICWATRCRAEELYDESDFCDGDVSASLLYLAEFAPEPCQEQFERKVHSLFETEALLQIIDNAMYRVMDFYTRGDQYHELLSKSYLTKNKYKTEELMEVFSMERTTFFDRKQEAILIFGFALWAKEIPQMKRALEAIAQAN